MKVYNDKNVFQVGYKLGTGASGDVYRVTNNDKICIKIFSNSGLAEFRKNLHRIKSLISLCPKLVDVAALPLHFVTNRLDRKKEIGYAMPLILGKEVHQLYSVSSREIHFPNADFRFLAIVAKNAAMATQRLHANQIVIGDISARNLMVRDDGSVCWIDADSFLIGNPEYTEIGRLITPEWTPPELQSNQHLHVPRLPGHDCFGLAVLIFHLLMLGRHPFQGRYTGNGPQPDMQSNIKMHYYAHAGFSAIPLVPPIGTPNVDHLGPRITDLFNMAFFSTSPEKRPSASEWVDALSWLERSCRPCENHVGHWFSSAAHSCPWCQVQAYYGDDDIFCKAQSPLPASVEEDAIPKNLTNEIDRIIVQLGIKVNVPSVISRPVPTQVSPTWRSSHVIHNRTSKREITLILREYKNNSINQQKKIDVTYNKQQRCYSRMHELAKEISEFQEYARSQLSETDLFQAARDKIQQSDTDKQLSRYLKKFKVSDARIPSFTVDHYLCLSKEKIVTAADFDDSSFSSNQGEIASKLLSWRKSLEDAFIPKSSNIQFSDIEKAAIRLTISIKHDLFSKRNQIMRKFYRAYDGVDKYAAEADCFQRQLNENTANIEDIRKVLDGMR